jgi:hypothetical protein
LLVDDIMMHMTVAGCMAARKREHVILGFVKANRTSNVRENKPKHFYILRADSEVSGYKYIRISAESKLCPIRRGIPKSKHILA